MNCRVQLQLCVVMAACISLSYSYGGSDPWQSPWLRRSTSGSEKRAHITVFDRMGRYFGKRSSSGLDNGFKSTPRQHYTVDDIEYLVSGSPRLLTGLIRGYIDQNGDDLIDEYEIADMKKKVMGL